MNNTEQNEFPRELLNKPREERFKYFQEYSVAHPTIETSFEKLKQVILLPSGKQLVFVIGPPGAGKTFLRGWIANEIKSFWADLQHTDPGRIPVAEIEIPSKDRVKPPVSDIYLRLLREMLEPLIDKKIIYGDVSFYQTENNRFRVSRDAAAPKLRFALEKCCEHRKPFYIALDEAQHLMNLAGMTLEELMDWLKSLANLCNVLICLYGTYEMYDLLDLSDQLMRRSKIIHLRRYEKTAEDFFNFKNTIYSFQKNLPFKNEFNLLAYSDYLYERTAGCVGNLYDWLLSAVNTALLEDKIESLEYKYLRATVPLTALQAQKMNKSISENEEAFLKKVGEEDSTDENKVNNPLKKNTLNKNDNSKKTQSIKSKRKSVGKRNPKRDPTGKPKSSNA